MSGNFLSHNGPRRALAFLLTLALLMGSLGFAGMAAGPVFAGEADNAIVAKEGLLRALDYYKTKEEGKLNSWEELLAIYSVGKLPDQTLNLKEWKLPAIPPIDGTVKSFTPAIITSLIRGTDPTALVTGLLSKETEGRFSDYADAQAYAILGLEIARSNGIEISESYNSRYAAEYLISLQDQNGGFFGEYDDECITNDTTGIVALALASYANEEEFEASISAIVSFFEQEQLAGGGFNYYYAASQWGPAGSFESANSTALAVWGLSAIKSRTSDEALKSRIEGLLSKALPALTKWQNADGSFGFSSSGLGEFDSMTSRQAMIALYMIANDENIFDQIQKNEVELVDSHIRIESDIHDPVDTHISSEKNESITASAETAWSKAGMTGSFTSEDYVFYLNDSKATPDKIISGSTNDILIIDNDVTTRAAFENLYLIGEMNNSQTVTLRNRETNEPLSGVIITINGDYVGYDSDMNPVTTDENGQLTIPADKLLAAGTYHISTSSSGISKDRCTIIVNQGTHDTKYVSVRVEGINENIVNEKQIVITTTGEKTLTASDAIIKALASNSIPYEISDDGYIDMIDRIANNYFGLESDDYDYWNFYINGQPASLGIANQAIDNGDEILLFYGNYYTALTDVEYVLEEGVLKVTLTSSSYNYETSEYEKVPVIGANVTISGGTLNEPQTEISDDEGIALFKGIEAGLYELQAVKYDTTVSVEEGVYLPKIVRLAPDYTIMLYKQTTISESDEVVDLSTDLSATPQSITVGAGATNPAIKISANSEIGVSGVDIISNNAGQIRMSIAPGTKVSSDPNWDGTIALPVITTLTLPNKTVSTAVFVGSDDYDITFDKPVRLLMPDVADKKIGFIDASGDFTEITTNLTEDNVYAANNQLAGAGKNAGKYISGNDAVIWTKHFTTFVAYTDNTPSEGGSNPGAKTVKITVKSQSGTIASDSKYVIEPGVTSILDVLVAVIEKAGKSIEIEGEYISEIAGLGEFDKGANSGWLCYIDKKGLDKPARAYKLHGGEVIEWIYTLDYTKESGSEQWNQVLLTEETTGTVAKNAINSVLKDLEAGKADSWTVSLASGDISFDKDALAGLVDQMSGDSVDITIEQASNKDLSAKQRQAAGDRPVYDISITSGKKNISQFGGKLTISLPYTLKDGERPSGIVVYHLDAEGNLVPLEGTYNPATGKVVFIVDHLSYFVIGYDETLAKWPFTDVAEDNSINWFYSPVKFVYERGIFSGTSATTFSPNSPLTRSMLASVLARMSGADLAAYKEVSFRDVDINSWYGPSVAWAKEMGIVSGYANKDGSFDFRPDAKISRQEIAVMINNYNEKVAKKTYDQKAAEMTFSDQQQIAEYARAAVKSMQQAGIINGIKNADGSYRFQPLSNATRAEAATMIYNMLINK